MVVFLNKFVFVYFKIVFFFEFFFFSKLSLNRKECGKQLRQLQDCSRSIGAAMLTLMVAVEQCEDASNNSFEFIFLNIFKIIVCINCFFFSKIDDLIAARALFFGLLKVIF